MYTDHDIVNECKEIRMRGADYVQTMSDRRLVKLVCEIKNFWDYVGAII